MDSKSMSKSIKEVKKETSEQKVQRLIGFSKREKIGLGLLLVFIILAPIIFTQFSSLYGFNADSGAIGDTIGGVTAPFVNLLAAYLVYKSFTAQIRANAQQREDHDKQMKQLNKEHGFNYISNYFALVKENYYSNKFGFDGHFVHIDSAINRMTRFKIDNDLDRLNELINLDSNSSVQNEIKIIKQKINLNLKSFNSNLLFPIKSITEHASNAYLFLEEMKKSDIDYGIKFYYRTEIGKMSDDMRLWKLESPQWKSLFNELKEYIDDNNQLLIEHFLKLYKSITQLKISS